MTRFVFCRIIDVFMKVFGVVVGLDEFVKVYLGGIFFLFKACVCVCLIVVFLRGK